MPRISTVLEPVSMAFALDEYGVKAILLTTAVDAPNE